MKWQNKPSGEGVYWIRRARKNKKLEPEIVRVDRHAMVHSARTTPKKFHVGELEDAEWWGPVPEPDAYPDWKKTLEGAYVQMCRKHFHERKSENHNLADKFLALASYVRQVKEYIEDEELPDEIPEKYKHEYKYE